MAAEKRKEETVEGLTRELSRLSDRVDAMEETIRSLEEEIRTLNEAAEADAR
jgi:hypothetical protein